MIEVYDIIRAFFSSNILSGSFISVSVLICYKYFFNRDTYIAQKILKWIIIFIALLNCSEFFYVLIKYDISKETAFYTRSFGEYWWAYWLMIIMNTIFPLFLLNKKLAKSLFFLLLVSLLMNIGWLFESFAIHITNFHKDFKPTSEYLYFPNPREQIIILKGLVFGVFLLVVGNIIKRLKAS